MPLRGIAAVEMHLRRVSDGGEMSHCCVSPPRLPREHCPQENLTLQRADGIQVPDTS